MSLFQVSILFRIQCTVYYCLLLVVFIKDEINKYIIKFIYFFLLFFFAGGIIPELDIYAIPSCETAPVREIYFIGIIDVLTHYGVKKQAAKAAKTVKYGSNVDGISTCDPDQYGKRFLDFILKAIE